jgi:membrane-associated protease RseP (regulator of RpoE activity)
LRAGTVVKLTYIREGRPGLAAVKLADRDQGLRGARGDFKDVPAPAPGPPATSPSRAQLGISVRTLTPELASSRGFEGYGGALIVGLDSGSAASGKGLQAGDLVVAVNGRRIGTEDDFEARLQGLASGSQLVLQVVRRVGSKVERRFVTLIVP